TLFPYTTLFRSGPQSHLLLEAAMDRILDGLALARVAAAGVGPRARPKALADGPLLEQELAHLIEHEQRECSMKRAVAGVRCALSQEADLAVGVVDKDQELVVERDDGPGCT